MQIPHSIDSQMSVFFWDIDEFLLLVGSVGFGFILKSFPIGIAGFCLYLMFKKFKAHAFEGALMHICFWIGLTQLNKYFVNGQLREFVE